MDKTLVFFHAIVSAADKLGLNKAELQELDLNSLIRSFKSSEIGVEWLVDLTAEVLPYLGTREGCIDCGVFNRKGKEIGKVLTTIFSAFGIPIPERLNEGSCYNPMDDLSVYYKEALGLEDYPGWSKVRFEKTSWGTTILHARIAEGRKEKLEAFEKLVKERGLPLEIARTLV